MPGAHTFTATLWRWQAREESSAGAWCFVTLPPDVAEDVRHQAGEPRGFGSVQVRVSAAGLTWDTSVFPDSGSDGFVLPVKKAVRVAADVAEGDELTVTLTVRDAQ